MDSLAPSNGARDRLIASHDLDALLRDLRCAHQRKIDDGEHYIDLPADLAALVEKFSELERGSPERFRYPIVRTPSRGGAKNVATQQPKRETSFPAPSVIPVEELWEIREQMTETDVECILVRAHEAHPNERPRIISDNGPQFIAKDFKEFVRLTGMTPRPHRPVLPAIER